MRRLVSLTVADGLLEIRGWKAHGYALGAGLRPTFSGVRGAWVTDAKRLPDMLAYLDARHVAVEVLEGHQPALGDRDVHRGDGQLDPDVDQPDIQLDLFGGGGDAA